LRLIGAKSFGAILLAGVCLFGASRAAAQNPDDMLPAQSEAKAKQILQAAIAAMGGPAYLNVHDVTCEGRAGTFGHSGELNGFGHFIDYSVPPDKERQENLPKRNIIDVFNGDKGWTLDRGGVSEKSVSEIGKQQGDLQFDIDFILRRRIHEKDMIFHYAGPDIVELKEADWVELVDPQNRTIRIAFDRATHLPIQEFVEIRDPETQTRMEYRMYFSNYHPISGIETPFQIARERNGIKVFQVFFDHCEYNTGLQDSLFTRESLEDRWAKTGKKAADKKARKEEEKEAKEEKENGGSSDSDSDSSANSGSNNSSSNGSSTDSTSPNNSSSGGSTSGGSSSGGSSSGGSSSGGSSNPPSSKPN
jgi:hypothetical protein